ncbi:MAG: FAD-dependent oxidoreductase [Candidatus Bathyarchaeia archaeon]
MQKKIVIVGANAAGVDAAVAARKTDRESEITLLTKDSYYTYSRCGLPFVLSGHIESFENLIVYPPNFFKVNKLDLHLETTVTRIDTKSKTVEALSNNGTSETFEYDKLVLATGATPFRLPIEGIDKQGVYTLHTLSDGLKLAEAMKTAKSAVVIGSGLVGLEATEAFVERGIKTTVVEMLPTVLPRLLDPDMSSDVQRKFEESGVTFVLGKSANAILGDNKVKGVSVGGEEIPADIVLNATGVRPNTELAQKAGIDIGETRGIKTNSRMQTSDENIYAAGDCAETIHLVTGKPALPLLGSAAVKMGKVAGINAAGGDAVYPGTLFSWVSRVFHLDVGGVGVTEFWAKQIGMDVVVGKITSKTRASYFPGGLPLKVKILVEKNTRRVVGGQIVGGEEVTQRINILSLAIQNRMSIDDLAKADTCYAPSVCEAWEPIVLAAEIAQRRL